MSLAGLQGQQELINKYFFRSCARHESGHTIMKTYVAANVETYKYNNGKVWKNNDTFVGEFQEQDFHSEWGFATGKDLQRLGITLDEPVVYAGLPNQAKCFLKEMREHLRWSDYVSAVHAVNTAFLTRKKANFFVYLVVVAAGCDDKISKSFYIPKFDALRDAHYHCSWQVCCGSGYKWKKEYNSFWRRTLDDVIVKDEVHIGSRRAYDL